MLHHHVYNFKVSGEVLIHYSLFIMHCIYFVNQWVLPFFILRELWMYYINLVSVNLNGHILWTCSTKICSVLKFTAAKHISSADLEWPGEWRIMDIEHRDITNPPQVNNFSTEQICVDYYLLLAIYIFLLSKATIQAQNSLVFVYKQVKCYVIL